MVEAVMTTHDDHDTPAPLGHDFPSATCHDCGWYVALCHC